MMQCKCRHGIYNQSSCVRGIQLCSNSNGHSSKVNFRMENTTQIGCKMTEWTKNINWWPERLMFISPGSFELVSQHFCFRKMTSRCWVFVLLLRRYQWCMVHGEWEIKLLRMEVNLVQVKVKKMKLGKYIFSTAFQIFLHHYVCYHLGIVEMSWSWWL